MTPTSNVPNPQIDASEDIPSNTSGNTTIGDIIAERLSRRDLMRGALAVSVAGAVATPLAIAASTAAKSAPASAAFTFPEVAAGVDATHHVAEGYDANILIRWGDKVFPDAPPFDPVQQSAERQDRQFGYNNDFLGYIPLGGSSSHGILVVNHEYTNDEIMFPGLSGASRFERVAALTEPQVRASMAAHGGSVLEVKRGANGHWQLVDGSRYARRITASTPVDITGPAAGHPLMKTSADPGGTRVLGMLNNCAGGVTPWGTWLTCEENFNFYFWGKEWAKASSNAETYDRYGVPDDYYPWGKYEDRFALEKEPNECHRFGWVVEIDPFDPKSTPKKRTALGRFKHEGAGNIVNKDGRFVVYQGDDQRFDYVYKFVTEGRVNLENRAANIDLLDRGTLYVARFDSGGRGEWLPLTADNPKLQSFKDQGEILIFARLAADALGATKMDRPEDIEANPKTGKVYVMLTNNKERKTSGNKGPNAANPRPENLFGHIIEMTPDGGDHAATGFTWEILLKCGDPSVATVGATFNPLTSKDGWFGMPDNCAIDAEGRLWIATDGNNLKATGRADGLYALETEGTARATSRLFFRCPEGAELCGPCFTPDLETLFVAVQHPGESEDPKVPATYESPTTRWPDFDPAIPPRPAVVAITRKGGGKIGG